MAVHLNPEALARVVSAPTGPAMRRARLTAEAIHDIAKTLIRTSAESHADGSPHLAETGRVEPIPGGYRIVFDAPYAAAYHNGATPHIIRAVNAKTLAFKWPARGGGMFFFPQVNHPGNAPHPFLRHAGEIVRASPLA